MLRNIVKRSLIRTPVDTDSKGCDCIVKGDSKCTHGEVLYSWQYRRISFGPKFTVD